MVTPYLTDRACIDPGPSVSCPVSMIPYLVVRYPSRDPYHSQAQSLINALGRLGVICLLGFQPSAPPKLPSLIHTSMQSSTVRSHSPFGDSAVSPQQSSTVANYTMASASGRSSSAASGRSQSAKSVVCRLSVIVIALFPQNLSLYSKGTLVTKTQALTHVNLFIAR